MKVKLSDLIGDTFEEPSSIKIPTFPKAGPVNVEKKLDWSIHEDPRRMVRMFKFEDESKFNAFTIDILELQSSTGHHGRITLQYPQIKVEVWTHTLMDLTEVDFEWAKKVNDIYGDHK